MLDEDTWLRVLPPPLTKSSYTKLLFLYVRKGRARAVSHGSTLSALDKSPSLCLSSLICEVGTTIEPISQGLLRIK